MPQLIASVEGVEIKHVYLQKDRTTLGRNPDNDIVFDNMVVSGHHCVFELKGIADVYIEDLRSTNGTYINGQMVKRQRLHDGEVIAIGNFRIQYLAASDRPSGFSGTQAMKLDASGQPARSAHAVFQVLNGSSEGLEMPVVKAVTTFGKPGVSVVAVSHRRDGYYVAHLDGNAHPSLNGDTLGRQPVLLSNHEYEGAHHNGEDQYLRDIRRADTAARCGWLEVRVSRLDLAGEHPAAVGKVRSALLSRGWRAS